MIEPAFGAEVTDAQATLARVALEMSGYFGKSFFRTYRSTCNNPDFFRRHVPDDRLAIVAKPIFDSGIHDLKTRRVPSVLHHQIASLEIVVASNDFSHLRPLVDDYILLPFARRAFVTPSGKMSFLLHLDSRDPRIVQSNVPTEKRIKRGRIAHDKADVVHVTHQTRPAAAPAKIAPRDPGPSLRQACRL